MRDANVMISILKPTKVNQAEKKAAVAHVLETLQSR